MFNGKQIFDIEITTRCNKQCYICPRRNFVRQNRDMSLEIFEKICKWLPSQCDIFFAGYGEPLLHNNHINFIDKLSKIGIRTSILTNGKLLSYNKICELYNAGLYKLQISILLKYEEKEILKFVGMIDKEYYNKTQFNLLYDETIKKPVSLVGYLKELGFKVYYKHIHNRAGQLYKNKNEPLYQLTCGTFLNVTYIDTNGYLQICSNDINGEYNLDNIETITFEEFINKKYKIDKNGIIAEICKQCDDEYRILNMQKEETQYGQ